MNCQQVNRLLPLWVGRDLADASEAEELRTHLTECSDCSLRQRHLQESLDVLQSISTSSLPGNRPSFWPRLATVLKEPRRRRDQFNGWIPASAMALAATLMIAVSAAQVRREMGDSIRAGLSQGRRNLFVTDARFAPGAQDKNEVEIRGLVSGPPDPYGPGF